MFARKETQESARFFPLEWQQEVEILLYETYKAQCQKDKSGFQVHGMTYPDEVLLVVSYVNLKAPEATPFTFFASSDLKQSTEGEKIMALLVDSVGIFFDQYFNAPETEHIMRWDEIDFRGEKIFMRTSRENILLTLEANQILGESTS